MRYLLGALALILSIVCQAAEPSPIDPFIAPPQFHLPKLSPDGKTYAVAIRAQEKLEYLSITDLTTGKGKPVATFENFKLINYWWKGDDLILLLIEDDPGYRYFRTVNVRTQKTNALYSFNDKASFVSNSLPEDPDNVLVSTYTKTGLELRRLNVRTGKTNLQPENAEWIWRWVTNRKGEAVAALGRTDLGRFDKKWFMLLPGKNGRRWRRVELGDKNQPDFYPLSAAPDQIRILGLDHTAGNTTAAVVWNPADDTRETVWQSEVADATGDYSWGDDPCARAIAYRMERQQYHYLTKEDTMLGQSIDQALPDTTNEVVSTSTDESRMIIRSHSPSQPERFLLLDRKTNRLALLGSPYPQIDPTKLARAQHFTATSADGLEIHGYIYLPRNSAKPPPAILLTDSDDAPSLLIFYPTLQYLVSVGYAVIEVDQRGTHGYGRKYAVAGDKQISSGMPDDFAAAVRKATQEGWVDGKRVAIMGFGKEGLVSLHTLARHPDLFAAWINLAVPMEGKTLDADDVLFGRYSESDVEALLGDSNETEKYLRTLDGYPLLAAVRIPSIHFYPREPFTNSLVLGGDKVAKFFAQSGLPHQFIKGNPSFSIRDFLAAWDEANRSETKRFYEQLTAFLDQYLVARK